MNKILIYLAILIIGSVMLLAGSVELDYFTAQSDGNVVNVQWKTRAEADMDKYLLQRADKNDGVFSDIETVKAKGTGSYYKYVDDSIIMKDTEGNPKLQQEKHYSYRLKMVGKDGSYNYSDQINVVHNISSIKRTWGMIKEMFR